MPRERYASTLPKERGPERDAKEVYVFHRGNGHHYFCRKCGKELLEGQEVIARATYFKVKSERHNNGSRMLHRECFVDAHGEVML